MLLAKETYDLHLLNVGLLVVFIVSELSVSLAEHIFGVQ